MASRNTQFRSVAPALVDQRRGLRHAVALTAIDQDSGAALPDNGPSQAVLHDLSIYGCRLHSASVHQVGERLWLRLAGGGPIAATAIWWRDSFVGCRFDAPIGAAMVRALTLGL